MAFPKKRAAEPTLLERVQSLIEAYEDLDDQADAAIDEYIVAFAKSAPGIPLNALREMEIDGRARSCYSPLIALQRLRERL